MSRIKINNGSWQYANTADIPQRGIDYWNQADQQAAFDYADAEMEALSENITFTLSATADVDLTGLTVKFVNTTQGTTEEVEWNGSALTFTAGEGQQYYFEADGSSIGIGTKTSVTYTAVAGNNREVSLVFEVEKLTVNVSGVDSGFEITVQEVEVIDGYTVVEYIESSGSQYIDTGVIVSGNNARIVYDFAWTSLTNATALFGSQTTSGTPYMVAYYAGSVLKFYCGTSSGILPISGLSANDRMVLDMNMSSNTLSVSLDGSTQTASYSGTIYNSVSMFLFGNSHSGTAKQLSYHRLYACQIYDNDTLVRDFVPVKTDAGVYGLYDKVNGVFYDSASSSTFTGGGGSQGDVIGTSADILSTFYIPTGTDYLVSASDISGYTTPTVQYFTATSGTNEVEMEYTSDVFSFTVYANFTDGYATKTFHAEEGMTWEDWLDSSYNNIGTSANYFFILNEVVVHTTDGWSTIARVYHSTEGQRCDDVLIANGVYSVGDYGKNSEPQ